MKTFPGLFSHAFPSRKPTILALLLLTLTLVLASPLAVRASPDFTISASPSQTPVYAGLPVNVTITVTTTGGFSGTITFSATAASGYTTSFNPASVTLSAGQSANSILSITADPSCPPPHNVIAKGTSGSLVHSTTIIIKVDNC